MRKWRRGTMFVGTVAGMATFLSSCTTLSSGITSGPPGVNKYSFRECLLENGFYSRQALSGIAYADWYRRHQEASILERDAKHPQPPAAKLLTESSGAFVLRATHIISNGLMPAVEFWQKEDRAGATPVPVLAGNKNKNWKKGFPDGGLNQPYVLIPGPKPYPEMIADQDRLTSHVAGTAERPDWRLNRFLDCYISPVGKLPKANKSDPLPDELSLDGDGDIEGRLIRAHILLAILARYGTLLVTSHASGKQVGQAELLLGHIAEAEKSLRSASAVWNPAYRTQFGDALLLKDGDHVVPFATATKLTYKAQDGKLQPVLRWAAFTERLLRVFQVGVDVEHIDAQQSLDRLGNILAAFNGPASLFNTVLKDSLSGIVTVQKTKIYGDAYLRDARETLHTHGVLTDHGSDGSWTYDIKATRAAWTIWDGELNKACQVLATIGQKDDMSANCVPDFEAATHAPAVAG